MKSKITSATLFFVFLSLALVFSDMFSSTYIEPKILENSIKDWRSFDDNFNNENCFKPSSDLGFEPVWGNCSFPEILEEQNDSKVLGDEDDDTFKIMILGDSNTNRANIGKPLEDNIISMGIFKEKKVQVVKIGVESYNTKQEVSLFQDHLTKLNPDLLIIQFTLNDFDFSPVVLNLDGKLTFMSSPEEPSIKLNKFMFEKSSIYRVLLFKNILLDKKFENAGPSTEVWNSKLASMNKSLDTLEHISSQNKTDLLFVIYPIFGKSQWTGELNTIKVLLNNRSIPYVDMVEESLPYGGPEAYEQKDTTDKLHPTRDFDNLVVNSIGSYLMKTYGDP